MLQCVGVLLYTNRWNAFECCFMRIRCTTEPCASHMPCAFCVASTQMSCCCTFLHTRVAAAECNPFLQFIESHCIWTEHCIVFIFKTVWAYTVYAGVVLVVVVVVVFVFFGTAFACTPFNNYIQLVCDIGHTFSLIYSTFCVSCPVKSYTIPFTRPSGDVLRLLRISPLSHSTSYFGSSSIW